MCILKLAALLHADTLALVYVALHYEEIELFPLSCAQDSAPRRTITHQKQ